MPPVPVVLTSKTVVDISHESLMRCWDRLTQWAEEESRSARIYYRLSQAAAWFDEGTAGLWRDPELGLGLQWREQNRPTAAWAQEYNSVFARTMEFLDQSEKERDRLLAEQTRARKRQLAQYQWAAGILAILLVIVGWLGYVARRESARAEYNLQLAGNAVDEMLSSAGRQQARVAADVPEMEEFRKELLVKAASFFEIFTRQDADNEQLRHQTARAHFRLGDIHRLLQKPGEAIQEYNRAVTEFESLARDYPNRIEYRRALADSYNWLGETLRSASGTRAEADKAYGSALRLQEQIVREDQRQTEYPRELARTHYNRGILRYSTGSLDGAETDFRAAIDLLTPLAAQESDSAAIQELARALNNLGTLLRSQDRLPEARTLYERAIGLHERLVSKEAGSREYRQELATFDNNLAMLLQEQQLFELAQQKNQSALDLLEELARPTLLLGMELAKAHRIRCQMVESRGSVEAETECQQSFSILTRLASVPASRERPEFPSLFRDLAYSYLDLASYQPTDSALARRALRQVELLLPEIPESERNPILKEHHDLQQRIRETLPKRN